MKENKVLENLLEKGYVEAQAKKLGLRCKPKFEYQSGNGLNYIMEAHYTANAMTYGLSYYVLTEVDTQGHINVNKAFLSKMQKVYSYRCGSMDAAVDITKIIVLHELRHLYQYETGMWVGYSYNPMMPKINQPMEDDANNYAYMASNTERMQEMAKFFRVEQSGQYVLKELRKQMHKMGMLYNPTWVVTGRIMGLL